jgi:hypothetical protein
MYRMEEQKQLKLFIFVIGSFEQPCYKTLLEMRKKQLEKYGIPYLILLDGVLPKRYILGEREKYIEKDNSFDTKQMNPHMIQKFLKGLMEFDETNYDYILRVNISTFLNIPLLLNLLEKQPRIKFAGGSLLIQRYHFPHEHILLERFPENRKGSFEMISGTCMIFSKDVINYLKTLPIESKLYESAFDDVILSFLVKEYCNVFTNIPMTFHVGNRVIGIKYGFPLYRVKHYDRKNDIIVWKNLLERIDGIKN